MSNLERGEVTIGAGDDTYTIRFSNRHLCELETDLNMNIQEILALFDNNLPSMRQTRIMFRRGLMEHHEEMTLETVSGIIDKIKYPELVQALLEGIFAAFPTVSAGKKKKKAVGGRGKSR